MEMKVLKEKKNELLRKKDYVIKITTEGATPSRLELKEKITKELNIKPELFVIKKVSSNYGGLNVIIKATLYDNEEALKAIEKDYLIKRDTPKKEGDE